MKNPTWHKEKFNAHKGRARASRNIQEMEKRKIRRPMLLRTEIGHERPWRNGGCAPSDLEGQEGIRVGEQCLGKLQPYPLLEGRVNGQVEEQHPELQDVSLVRSPYVLIPTRPQGMIVYSPRGQLYTTYISLPHTTKVVCTCTVVIWCGDTLVSRQSSFPA